MALSRLDLPSIRSAIEDLYRILENPTTDNATANRVHDWSEMRYDPKSRLPPGNKPHPAALINAGLEQVLHRLMPSGVNIYEDAPDITDSNLDLQHKSDLLELREQIIEPFAVSSQLANSCALRLRYLRMLQGTLESLNADNGHAAAREANRTGETPKKPARGKNINARMIAVLLDNRDAFGWTAKQWAGRLGCSDGTIKGTKTWKVELRKARAVIAAEAPVDRSRTTTTGRRKGKRSSQG